MSYKKNALLLFINNRLVENDKIKRTVDAMYNMFQPKGGYSYFVYMALSIRPDLIDVNVHPTKKQVIFERQEELSEALQGLMEQKLNDIIANRNFEIDNIHKKQSTLVNKEEEQNQGEGDQGYTHTKVKDL